MKQVQLVRGMGEHSGAFRELRRAYVEVEGSPYRCLDLLNHLLEKSTVEPPQIYENVDFLWPVILYLGSYLHRRGLSFDYVNLVHRSWESFRSKLRSQDYHLIAITTTIYVSPHPITEIVKFIRSERKDAAVVIGGPYVSDQAKALPRKDLAQLMKYLGGDYYVISNEGEATLVALANAIRDGTNICNVPNLAYRDGSSFAFTEVVPERSNLEQEPVNYALFGREEIGEFVSLRTAKSCPFACNFCGFPQRAGKYVYTSVEHVGAELDAIANLGSVSTLTFVDDTFNVPKGRFKEILRLMIDRKYGFHWNSFYRSDCGDDETIELMAEAGCEGVFLGIESGSDKMLELMNKTARRVEYTSAIKKFKSVDILTYASLIVGFPGETLSTVQETIDFIEDVAPHYYRAQLYYLDPGTAVWRDKEKFQISGSGFAWKHGTMTSEVASDLIDRMFLTIRNSIWMPQDGFEQWSLFYLQRKGFSLEQINFFVRGFNLLIRGKLLKSQDSPDRQEILRGLKMAARDRAARTGALGRTQAALDQRSAMQRKRPVIPIVSLRR
jgi:radical SAM PhpK family P-methyltransferase